MSEMLILLEKRIRWSALRNALIALVVFALALIVLAAAGTRARTTLDPKTAMVAVFGALFLWAAWVMAGNARRLVPVKASRVFRELSGDARGIAWTHLTVGSYSAINIYFLDGTMCTLYASRRDCEKLLELVTQKAPHAILGFGREQERAYAYLVAKSRARG